ncbi:MGH1-like glycoside hydrolase domain-containing protein [Prosthecobacter sp.]|uniref:MGH1-like glycoside hydrolase domain-containing protein n=1 Tax=Prosthecobacter sp. TaxID=1965333 RepID=UPI00378480B2
MPPPATPEHERLLADRERRANWKRWGPYLSERQWSTVREDYSADGDAWESFPHEQAHARAYRWGEDGLLGITDRQCRLCFALALWNHRDPILKERLYGLTGPQGNHAEDVKELYYYLDSTPTHSYLKALYKYPQAEFPYQKLVEENAKRGLGDPEFEITDTDAFEDERYFDVFAEYAKAAPEDILIRITLHNRGPEAAPLDVLPTLWYRNTWSWDEGVRRPQLKPADGMITCSHSGLDSRLVEDLGSHCLQAAPASDGTVPQWLFTDNDSNQERLFASPNDSAFTKDAFHRYLISGEENAVNPAQTGTKAAALYRLKIPAGGSITLSLRLCEKTLSSATNFGPRFEEVFKQRIEEADAFYHTVTAPDPVHAQIQRQAFAGLLWSKQFYHYVVAEWLQGDPAYPPPPESRKGGRNHHWQHLYARDVLSMPDKWEYPWFAAWDAAFHMLPFAELDPDFAKEQLLLFLREWYMHPNGQLPAYEWKFSDVNPPVHAWACWRVYKITAPAGKRDREFLERCFQKLLLNFTWWVNRKDSEGHNLFSGGFLGLDNIGIFDRSQPLPGGERLEQADGTGWMAFYALTMLNMALELAQRPDGTVNTAYEDMASKFFEHFVEIVDAINTLGDEGLWDEVDGFYYDELHNDGRPAVLLRTRSLVGLVPLIAVELLDEGRIASLPGFKKRMDWFLRYRADLSHHVSYCESGGTHGHRLLAIPSRQKLERLLGYLLNEEEFLSPFGIRSLSKYHEEHPFTLQLNGSELTVRYVPGESDSHMFGGNSNWRGPVWFPLAYLIVEALERYHHFYGNHFTIELPTGSGQQVTLQGAANEISRRLTRLFEPDASGHRPCHNGDVRYATNPAWKDLVLFHEYFHADTGRGCGASHQTGWTALVARLVRKR